jgi:hypothetical protein
MSSDAELYQCGTDVVDIRELRSHSDRRGGCTTEEEPFAHTRIPRGWIPAQIFPDLADRHPVQHGRKPGGN